MLFGKSDILIEEAIKRLKVKFDLKILGRTRKLLGVEFEEIGSKLYIHQSSYIKMVCDKFKKFKYPTCTLPIAKGTILSKTSCPETNEEKSRMSKLPYRNILGCISYIAGRTRPDLSYAVNVLSHFQENYGQDHWYALMKLLGYLEYTKDYKLDLSKVKRLDISCFSDSDFAANRDDRISMGGIIMIIDQVPIMWKTFKQKSVCLSTMEAEYVSLTEAAKEIMWIKRILQECESAKILNLQQSTFTVFCDNQAAIDFSNSPIENSRTKHIDVKYHFIRNLVYEQSFNLRYISSNNNLADIFTKPVTRYSLRTFNTKIFKY